jgi:hypothetical protein
MPNEAFAFFNTWRVYKKDDAMLILEIRYSNDVRTP